MVGTRARRLPAQHAVSDLPASHETIFQIDITRRAGVAIHPLLMDPVSGNGAIDVGWSSPTCFELFGGHAKPDDALRDTLTVRCGPRWMRDTKLFSGRSEGLDKESKQDKGQDNCNRIQRVRDQLSTSRLL